VSEQTVKDKHPERHGHEDCTQGEELEQRSSAGWLNELRHECQEEDRQFRVEDIEQKGFEDDGERWALLGTV
jgi:hypothetical protein